MGSSPTPATFKLRCWSPSEFGVYCSPPVPPEDRPAHRPSTLLLMSGNLEELGSLHDFPKRLFELRDSFLAAGQGQNVHPFPVENHGHEIVFLRLGLHMNEDGRVTLHFSRTRLFDDRPPSSFAAWSARNDCSWPLAVVHSAFPRETSMSAFRRKPPFDFDQIGRCL